MRRLVTDPAPGARRLLAIITLGMLSACQPPAADFAEQDTRMLPTLVPAPASLERLDGELALDASTRIIRDDPAFAFWSQALADELGRYAPAGNAGATIRLQRDADLDEEAYRLVIDKEVLLAAATATGLGHGVQSLTQLLATAPRSDHALLLPRLEIGDAPRFGWRGMHLDVSRHFFDVAFVKKYIDLLALHKMNVLHWHLTDDQGWRIEIEAYPALTGVGATRSGTVRGHSHDAGAESDGVEHGGFYTQQEIRDVVAYAADRGITIVPEIDVPGHASAIIAAYPQFGCGPDAEVKTHFGIFKHVLCPTAQTFEFLDTVIGEIAGLFPGPWIHIGGDEVITEHWEDCEACSALMARESIDDMAGLQHYFFERTAALVTQRGKIPVGWDEILSDDGEAAGVVMAWRGVDRGIKAAEHGHDVVMTPVTNSYFDFYQSTSLDEPMSIHGLTRLVDVYGFEPAPADLAGDVRAHILGGQGTLWTEYVADTASAERQVLPRLSALAEVLWSAQDRRDFADFVQRLESFVPFLEARGYTVSDAHFKPEILAARNPAGGFDVTIDASAGAVHYTLDGSEPSASSALYEAPLQLDDSATIRARTRLPSGEWTGDSRLSVVRHAGLDATITGAGFSDNQNSWANSVLRDGKLAADRIFHYGDWFALDGRDLDLQLEWPEPRDIHSVSVGVDAGLHRKLVRPSALAVFAWQDGGWQAVAAVESASIAAADKRVTLRFEPVESARLRLLLENPGPAWSAEKERLADTTLRVDEIVVE